MPRFYFHLSAPDQDFKDKVGSDVADSFLPSIPAQCVLRTAS